MFSFLKKPIFAAFLCLGIATVLFFFPASVTLSEEKGDQDQILVLGTARIAGGNVASAKEVALSEALMKGVEEYLTRRLGPRGMVNNFPRIIHELLPRAKEQVENFHILAEEKTERQINVLVRVKINEKLMEEKLREIGLVLMEGPPIKVLFLVSQAFPDQGRGTYWWMDPENMSALTETELILFRFFQERGFHPINRLSYAPEGDFSPEMRTPELSEGEVIRWGRAFAADVAVYGVCNITRAEGVFVSLTAFDISAGGVMAEATRTEILGEAAAGPKAIQEAMDRAIGGAAADLGPGIIHRRQMAEKNVNAFALVLMGIKNFKQYRTFRDFLGKDIPGVRSVQQKKIKGNSLYLAIEYDGDPDALIDMISNHPKRPFPLDIMKNEEGAILVHIR